MVSLLKNTVNNANGNVTPNLLLYGLIDYKMSGDVSIQAPSGASDGQLFGIKISGLHNIAWDTSYQAPLEWPALPAQGSLPQLPTKCWLGLFIYNAGKSVLWSQTIMDI